MKYILDRRFRLRGWHKLPTGVYDARDRTARFYEPELYRLLLFCDAAHEIDTDALTEEQRTFLDNLLREGVIRPADRMDFLLPEQRYKAYPARYRREAHWSITGECNFRCAHCFMSAPSGKHGSPSYEQIVHVADMLAECGVFCVGLTGGEPLIRPDFNQILDALTQREIAVTTLYTNGWLVNEKLLDELATNERAKELLKAGSITKDAAPESVYE